MTKEDNRGGMLVRHRIVVIVSVAVLACSSAIWTATADLPKQIKDDTFWQMVSEFSESGGSFPYDNFVSNEITFQKVIPRLKEVTKPGGVYLGVGPEQNFTYIIALQPRIAFIIDIRRQNMLEHLIHKALIEVSSDRAEYLSLLFSRKRPRGIHASSTAKALFAAYDRVSPDRKLFDKNLKMIWNRLTRHHRFKLTMEDKNTIETVYDAFFKAGPDLTYYGFKPPIPRLSMATYEELMTQTDGAGLNRSYMASEYNFRILKALQKRNLIVPVVGDFAGPKALRAVGQYLKEHRATVTTIYASNVEQYLFQKNGNWQKYYFSLATLPIDPSTIFIRSFNRMPPACPKCVTVTLTCTVADLLRAFRNGQIENYRDAILMSQ